jgi:hypothetical protein
MTRGDEGARRFPGGRIHRPTADPYGIINQGHGNATAKAVQIFRGDAINGAALLAMFRAVIANNRAGGWRRIQA